jgi:tetratricopeptide (TPR) repeat protein
MDPHNVFALNALGDAYYGLGEREKAIDAYRKGVTIDPEDAAAHFNLGELYYDMDDLAEAEKECAAAVRLDPSFPLPYLTMGSICLDQERITDAIKYFELYLKNEKSPRAEETISEVRAVLEGLKEEAKQ